MCVEPGSAAAIAIGITQAVAQAGLSIAKFSSDTQAARASERAYQEQRNLNQEAANRSYQQYQLKIKGEMEQASQKAEQLLVQRLQSQGTTLSAGRTGFSISGLLADAERVEGKDLGSLGMNLAYANQDFFLGMENTYQNQKTANVQAASQRLAKPSIGGLALELGGAVLSGVSAGMSLAAPSAGGGGGSGGGTAAGSTSSYGSNFKSGLYSPTPVAFNG